MHSERKQCIFFPGSSFSYESCGETRQFIVEEFDFTICGPVFEFGLPMAPTSQSSARKANPFDWAGASWKCQTTTTEQGYVEELYEAYTFGELRCYDDDGDLIDETDNLLFSTRRWPDKDEWRKVEGSDFSKSHRGPVFP